MKVGEKVIQFDHGYPSKIVHTRRTYLDIKRALREKGIHFHTPFMKIRIHWNDGVKIYSAREAIRDMKTRGFTLNMPKDADEREGRLCGAPGEAAARTGTRHSEQGKNYWDIRGNSRDHNSLGVKHKTFSLKSILW